tara:strand:- start:643 stop:1059 length:417 start_codon:yes stop_codon:yes gene_type:complete
MCAFTHNPVTEHQIPQCYVAAELANLIQNGRALNLEAADDIDSVPNIGSPMQSQNRFAHDRLDIDAIKGQVIGHGLMGDMLAVSDKGTEAVLLHLPYLFPYRRHLVVGPHVRWHYVAHLVFRFVLHSWSSFFPVNTFN